VTLHSSVVHFVLALALVSTAAQSQTEPTAQTIYKCTTGGQISYGQAPCTSGHTVALDPVAAPATKAADHHTRVLRQQAEQLSGERHRREAKEERIEQRASAAAARARDNCARLRLHKKWADEDAALARNKGQTKSQTGLKARRAAEKLALACPQ
jgi:hypothetical protein